MPKDETTIVLQEKYKTNTLASLYILSYSCSLEELSSWKKKLLHQITNQEDHPDILTVRLEIDEKRYSVDSDSISNLISFINFKPINLKKKLIFIEHADLLGKIISNKLLKIFEELPSYVSIFLLSSKSGTILPTVASRAITIQLNKHTCARHIDFQISDTPQNTIIANKNSVESDKEIIESLILKFLENVMATYSFEKCEELLFHLKITMYQQLLMVPS